MTITSPPTSPLATLLTHHLPLVYAAALRQTHNPHLAEDITQSVFLLAAKKHASIPPNHTAAWLLKVTHYLTLTALRADRRRRLHEQRAASEAPTMTTPEPTPTPTLDTHLDRALAALSQSDRELLLRRYFHNHPVASIAAALHLTPNTTTKRLTRALEKLRHHLTRAGLPESSLAALPASLLAITLHSPPPALHAKILAASTTAKLASLPLGALLMTTTLKTSLTLAAALLLLAAIPTIYVTTISHHTPIAPPTTPIAAPIAPVSADGNDTGFTTLTGTVSDPAGKPLANALVSHGNDTFLNTYIKTRTDTDGHFSLPHIKIGSDLALTVQAPGFAPEFIPGSVPANPWTFNFSLKPAATLRLRLIDSRGNPLPNFALDPEWWRNTQVLRSYTFQHKHWTGPTSDADGLVTWNNAPADPVTFRPIGQYAATQADVDAHPFLSRPFTVTATPQLQTITIRDPIHVTIHATDADAHKPLPQFTVTYGYGDSPTHVVYWKEDATGDAADGAYETDIRLTSYFVPYQFFRVTAPGYAPVIQSFKDDRDNPTLTFQLARQDTTLLSILQPDKSPATNASIYVITSSQNFSLQSSDFFHNARVAGGATQPLQHTDSAGRLSVANPHDPAARIVILHDSGFAELLFSDAAKSPITLQPWASLDGTAHIGTQLAAHKTISVNYTANHEGEPYISGTFTTTTDDTGHFAFPQLPPAHSFVGVYLEANTGTRYAFGTIANPTELTLTPGENHLTLGGAGRLLTGRILNPDNTPLHAGITTMGELVSLPPKELPAPPELLAKIEAIRKLPHDQALAAVESLRNSPEARAYDAQRAAQPHIHEITFPIAPDGTFEIPDVTPDTYTLDASILDLHTNHPLGAVHKPLTIPDSPNPLPLGDLPLTPPQK